MLSQKELESKTNEELLILYKQTNDQKIKQTLVLRYIYIVKNIAMQMRGIYLGFSQIDDIINEGVLAIMTAIDKFDINKHVKFETYISKRIRGMIIDIARKQDWVPRSIRKSAKEIEEAQNILSHQLGRTPTDEEVANHLQISIKKYKEDLGKTGTFNLLSLDMLMEEEGVGQKSGGILKNTNELLPEQYLQKKETAAALKEGLASLREKEQMVLSLYYINELNMKEISVVMQVSEPRISQIHANAIRKLRNYMQRFFDEKE